MSTPTAAPEAVKKSIAGTLFMKQAVELAPKEDGTPRVMGVLHVQSPEGVVRITDFSNQHRALVEDQPIKVVYEETQQVRNERPVTFRNLETALQPEA